MEENVFNFDDFLNKPKKSKLVVENNEETTKITNNETESKQEESEENYTTEVEETYEEETEVVESKSENDEDFYKVYKDINEEFSCDIEIEGADKSKTEARLVLETKDWNLMFKGTIKNGKCNIPIKKLNIFDENQEGDIRLEVIAEGNLFVPWEDKFKVKLSKKVTVKVNEKKETKKPVNEGASVKVKIKKS